MAKITTFFLRIKHGSKISGLALTESGVRVNPLSSLYNFHFGIVISFQKPLISFGHNRSEPTLTPFGTLILESCPGIHRQCLGNKDTRPTQTIKRTFIEECTGAVKRILFHALYESFKSNIFCPAEIFNILRPVFATLVAVFRDMLCSLHIHWLHLQAPWLYVGSLTMRHGLGCKTYISPVVWFLMKYSI